MTKRETFTLYKFKLNKLFSDIWLFYKCLNRGSKLLSLSADQKLKKIIHLKKLEKNLVKCLEKVVILFNITGCKVCF